MKLLRIESLLLLLASCASAQLATTTSLVGTITDSSGQVIANANVTAVETGTADKYTAMTNGRGYYALLFVRVGRYNITAEASGFQKVTKTGIIVEINQTVRTDIALAVGALTQSVIVEGAVGAIKTDDAALSEIMSGSSISDLPLARRDVLQLARMVPGVFVSAQAGTINESFNGNGMRQIQNSLSLDGVNIANNLSSLTPNRPMVEAVQEVEIQTGTYSAQYGAYLGAHINVVSRTGTNQLHGALVEYFRNQVLDARNFFTVPTPQNPTAATPPLRQNQFGGEVDGPVIIPKLYNGKNKTFFMASYEGLRLVQQTQSLLSLMPPAYFNGDFSLAPTSSITGGAIKDRLNGNAPFPGNIIPASRISPVITKLQKYYPAPNLTGLSNNYSLGLPYGNTINQTLDRIDQNIGDRIRLYARAHRQDLVEFNGMAVMVNATTVTTGTTNYVVGYTHTLTPNLVNDFHVGRSSFNNLVLNYFAVNGIKSAGTDLGIPGFTGDSLYNNPGIPNFTITGFLGFFEQTGTVTGANLHVDQSTEQLSEQISWAHGSHNIVAGLELERLADGRAFLNNGRGIFNFNGALSGYAAADFVLGLPVSFTTPGPAVRGHVAQWRDGFFVTDKWQVSRKLTLNYGLRYELPTVPYTLNGNATELNEKQTALIGGTPGFRFTAPNHGDWAPRLGIAYRISEKTVFRAGGGIYYNANDLSSYTSTNANPPYTAVNTCTWSTGLTPLSLSNPLGVPAACPPPGSSSIFTDLWRQPTGRSDQWSAGLERQLWSGGGLEVQYVGSHAYHLDRNYYNNTPLLPGPGAVNSRLPNPLFGVIRAIANDEIANYESMSVIFHQRMSHGLQMLASYTWSHTLDVSNDANNAGAPMNPYNWKADYGNSAWDIRHRFVASFVYDIPFFATSIPILRGVFAQWQMNGVVTLQTGIPFNVGTGTDTANTASSGTYRPNQVGPATEDCGRGHLVSCIDPTAFSVAGLYPATSVYAYGNAGRDLFHGPGAETVDWSMIKNYPIRERLKFQIRFETFALFNHPNFGKPSATINTASFGSITSATGSRTIQLGAKLSF